MGTLAFISKTLPFELEKASRDMRKKQELTQRIYDVIPRVNKTRFTYPSAIAQVYGIYKSWNRGISIIHLIDMTDANIELWTQLEEYARKLKNGSR